MALQIIQAKVFEGSTRPAFVYADLPAPRLVGSFNSIFNNLSEILNALDHDKTGNNLENVFYTLAHHVGIQKAIKPQRSAETFEFQNMIPWDIDHADTIKAFDYAECVAQVLGCTRSDLTLVNSGNGVQIFAQLKHRIQSSKYFSQNRLYYKEICLKIAEKMKSAGLPGVVDPSVFDPARIMRLPGTRNKKPGKIDKECVVLQHTVAQLDIDLKIISGFSQAEAENISPIDVKRTFPHPDFQEMVKECDFIEWCIAHPEEVHEPHLFDLLSFLVVQDPLKKVFIQEKEYSPREVGLYVFERATASASLARADFDNKWEQSSRYGVRKCSTIKERWDKACEGCPHWGKIATPVALKSKTHIGSEVNGYWVLNAKGQPIHPHYGDLGKVFELENPYITDTEGRLIIFDHHFYDEQSPFSIKRWLENKLIPSDPIREHMRNEFLSKLRTVNALTSQECNRLFNETIKGTLNCQNGILQITTGELLPHSSNYGHRYILPYDFIPDEPSTLFMEWLTTIMQGRLELIHSILDMMAYTLWPTYDDHVFIYFIGEQGKNGKSTLMNIIRAVIGAQNHSDVNIEQLTGNRFAVAELEGKLANFSEESSGIELDSERMGRLKDLSSGGTMFVERKNENGFSFKNKAKLFFSANKAPRFVEQNGAIKRRLLTIPFDYDIQDPNSKIEDQLLAEAPKILSMLVKRVQENVARNQGRFLVSRGGKEAEKARKKVFTTGNTVVEWANEFIESSETVPENNYVVIKEAYALYTSWCEENGFRNPQNKISFGKTMTDFVLAPLIAHKHSKKRVGKETLNIYPHTRYKNGEENVI